MILIRFFGLRGRCTYSARTRTVHSGLLDSVKAGKPAEILLRFSPFLPVQGQLMGMEKPVSFTDKFSKLFLVKNLLLTLEGTFIAPRQCNSLVAMLFNPF